MVWTTQSQEYFTDKLWVGLGCSSGFHPQHHREIKFCR